MAFIVGLVVGVGLGLVALAAAVKVNPRVQALVSGLILPSAGLPDEIVSEVKASDPGLAEVLQSAPAVPVASMPEEVTQAAQKAIAAAPTAEAAVEVARRFIHDPDVARAVTTLARWRTRRGNAEIQYQNSFRSHASKNGYAGKLEENKRVEWGAAGSASERRVAIPDYILDKKVLVELKADLLASGETDRAMGQMLRYLLAWKKRGPAVLAICGDISPELKFLVRVYVNTWRRQLNLPVTVFFKNEGDETDIEMPEGAPRLEADA